MAARDCSISPVLPRGPSHGGFKLKEGGFGFVIRKKFLLLRHWCRLPRETVGLYSNINISLLEISNISLLEISKVRFYGLSQRSGERCPWSG